jgi:hypothetical protein
MLVTASEPKTGLGSLVGVKVEDLPSLKKQGVRSQNRENQQLPFKFPF